jgi:cytochrome oxidase Cu insertion factor (SCO1/SenC/PrrC family)
LDIHFHLCIGSCGLMDLAGPAFRPPDHRRNSGSPTGFFAPGFTLIIFDGKQVSQSDFNGKVVLINFWVGPQSVEDNSIKARSDKMAGRDSQ